MEPRLTTETSTGLIASPQQQGLIVSPYSLQPSIPSTANLSPQEIAQQYIQSWQGPDKPIEDEWELNIGKVILSGLQGYASGFLALEIGDQAPQNHIERLVRQTGHLAGFIGLGFPIFGKFAAGSMARMMGLEMAGTAGMSSFLQAVSTFRSVPMFVADRVIGSVSKGQAFKYLAEGTFKGSLLARQTAQQSIHLGTAMAVSSWQQGLSGAIQAGLQGMLFGGLSAGMGNLPIMRDRTTPSAILRAATGAVMNTAMGGGFSEDAHWTDTAYQMALGAYFGYIQPTAEMARAQEYLFRELPPEAYGRNGPKIGMVKGEGSDYWKLPESVQREVDTIMGDLYAEDQVGGALYHTLKRMGGLKPEAKEKRLADNVEPLPSVARTLVEMESLYPSTTPSGKALQQFALDVRKTATSLLPWRNVEIARLADSVGGKARREKLTYEEFRNEIKTQFEKSGVNWDGWDNPALLARYYNIKMSTGKMAQVGLVRDKGGYKILPTSESGLDLDGNALNDSMPLTIMHHVGKALGLEDTPDAVMYMVKGIQGRRWTKESISGDPLKISGLLMDPMQIYGDRTTFRMPTSDGAAIDFNLVESTPTGNRSRYYPIHAAGNKDSIVMIRYLESNRPIQEQIDSGYAELAGLLVRRGEAKNLKEANESIRASADEAYTRMVDNSPYEDVISKEEWERRNIVSNINWYKAVFLSGNRESLDAAGKKVFPWQVPLARMDEGNYIKDLADFNKRLQPLFTNYHPIHNSFVGDVRYAVVPDMSKFVKVKTDGRERFIGDEVSDGETYISQRLYDRIAKYMEFAPDGSSIKPFILHDSAEKGLLIGKTAMHVASDRMVAAMERAGIDMIITESSAKQFGTRKSKAFRIKGKNLEFAEIDYKTGVPKEEWSTNYEHTDVLRGENIFMDPGQKDKTAAGSEIAKQMLSMAVPEIIGRDAKGQFSRELARERSQLIDTQVIFRNLQSSKRAVRALQNLEENYSRETIDALFKQDKDGRSIADETNPINLLEAVTQVGREDAYAELINMLLRSDDAAELVKSNPEDATYFYMDEGEMDSAYGSVYETRGAGDALVRQAMGRMGPMMHKAAYNRLDTLISNWIINRISRPYVKSALKSIMKGYDMGHATEVGYDDGPVMVAEPDGTWHAIPTSSKGKRLRAGSYMLEGSAHRVEVPLVMKDGTTENWSVNRILEYMDRYPNDKGFKDRARKALSVTSVRNPITDASGVRELDYAARSKGRGWGTVLHEKDMKYEGGADLDIDSTTLYWNLPDVLREVYRAAQNEKVLWDKAAMRLAEENDLEMASPTNPKGWSRVKAFLRKPEDIVALQEDATAADRLVGMFDSYQRLRLGMEVARGRAQMAGVAVSTRTLMHYMYSAANENDGVLRVPASRDGRYEIEYRAARDNGTLFRALGDAAVTSAVDVAKFGGMVDPTTMRGTLLNAAFREINIIDTKTGEIIKQLGGNVILNDAGEAFVSSDVKSFLWNRLKVEGHEPEFGLSFSDRMEQPMGALSRINRALYGRNYDEQRAWMLHERVSNAEGWPDIGGLPFPGFIGNIAQRVAQIKDTAIMKPMLNHVLDNLTRYEGARRMWQQGFSDYGEALWGWMRTYDTRRGNLPGLPDRVLLKFLRVMRDAGTEKSPLHLKDDLLTFEGRSRIAYDGGAWKRLQEAVNQTGLYSKPEEFFKLPEEYLKRYSGDERIREVIKWRRNRITDIYRRLNEFISNDYDDVAALWTIRDMKIKSGLFPDEARRLVDKAADIKARAAAVYSERASRKDRELREYREGSASSLAESSAREEYLQFVVGGKLREFVRRANEHHDRRAGREPELKYEDVLDFFDSAMLSPWHTKEGKMPDQLEWASRSRNFGFSVASDHVVAEFAQRYNELYVESVQGRAPSPLDLQTLITHNPTIDMSHAGRAVHDFVKAEINTKVPVEKIDPELMKATEALGDMASNFAAFRNEPKDLVHFLLHHAGVAQPKDLTLNDIKTATLRLKRMKKGYGFFKWVTGLNMDDVQAVEAAKKFNPVTASLFFPETTADMMMLHDMKVYDSAVRSRPVMRMTYTQNADGSISSHEVPVRSAIPMSSFHRLIRLHGEQAPRLEDSMESDINKEMQQYTDWMYTPMKHAQTGKDVQKEVMSLAIHQMEMNAAIESASNAPTPKARGRWEKIAHQYERRVIGSEIALREALNIKKYKESGILLDDQTFTYTDANGNQKLARLNEVVADMTRSLDAAFSSVADKYILANKWFETNLKNILSSSKRDISTKSLDAALNDIMEFGVAQQGHIPMDVARLVYYEDIISERAKGIVDSGKKVKLSEADIVKGGSYGPLLERVGMAHRPREIVTEEDAVALYKDLWKLSEKEGTPAELKDRLKEAALYFWRPFSKSDMRRLWMGSVRGESGDGTSQFSDDILFSRGHMTAEEHTKRILRSDYPLLATTMERGYWPHLDFDPVKLGGHVERWINNLSKNKNLTKEKLEKEARSLANAYNETLGRGRDPDAGMLDNVAAFILEDGMRPEFEDTFLQSFARPIQMKQRERNFDGYRTDLGAMALYSSRLARATYGNISNMLSRRTIKTFERERPMGEYTPAWSKWMRIYVRDTMGKPTVFPESYFNDEHLQLKKMPYYWLSDHWMATNGTGLNRTLIRLSKANKVTVADRAYWRAVHGREMTKEEVQKFQDERLRKLTQIDGKVPNDAQAKALGDRYRGLSEMEAKYEMMSLLFHTKTVATNILGGTANTIISAGWRNFHDAGKLETWQTLAPGRFKDYSDVRRFVEEHGVVENWIVNEFAAMPRYRTDEGFRNAVDRGIAAIRKDPMVSDQTLFGILREAGLTERLAELAARPMRESERRLRTRAFLAGLLQARQSMYPVRLDIDHPHLIEMGRKTVATSQFLYDAANRPPFARTSLGKIWSRFRIWSWSSVKMRRQIYQESRNAGHAIGSPDHERLRRMIQADMFAVGLASFFPFTILETAGLPSPYNWLKDLADYFFGDEFEHDTAFFSSPLGPANELIPVVFGKTINAGDEIFSSLIGNEKEVMSMYPIAAMFPFGRMARDVYRSISDPSEAMKYIAGIPLRDFNNYRTKISNRYDFINTSETLLTETINGATQKQIIEAYEAQGYSPTQARRAINFGMENGVISRQMDPTTRAYWYYTTADEEDLNKIITDARRRVEGSAPMSLYLR